VQDLSNQVVATQTAGGAACRSVCHDLIVGVTSVKELSEWSQRA
jgi:hypothetical protein